MRATPDTFWSSLEKLSEAVRECSPALRHTYARDRLSELLRVFVLVRLARGWCLDPSQFIADIPDRIDHFLSDSPITLRPDGELDGWETADMPHFQQLRDYRASSRPPGRRGRPSKEEALACVVYAKDRDGQHYDLYDEKDAKRAYTHFYRLRGRGRLIAASRGPAQGIP